VYHAINPTTRQAVAVKNIELKGFREDEIVQLRVVQEVDLVKKLSHPSLIKYEGLDRDESILSIMLACVPPLWLRFFFCHAWLLTCCVALRVGMLKRVPY